MTIPMRIRRHAVAILILAVLAPAPATAFFEQVTGGVKGTSMGGAYGALVNDASGLTPETLVGMNAPFYQECLAGSNDDGD